LKANSDGGHALTNDIGSPQHTRVPFPAFITLTLLPQILHKYISFSFDLRDSFTFLFFVSMRISSFSSFGSFLFLNWRSDCARHKSSKSDF